MRYPTLKEITKIHRKYAASQKAYEIVYTHCTIVHDIALACIEHKQIPINTELVRAGALLHDIGAYMFINKEGMWEETKPYIQHGTIGQTILEEEGLSNELCTIASHHTGVGITKEEIINQSIPLPHKDFTARTQEERLIMYADKFHSKTPLFHRFGTYRSYLERFPNVQEKQKQFDTFAEEFGIPDVATIAEKYHHPID